MPNRIWYHFLSKPISQWLANKDNWKILPNSNLDPHWELLTSGKLRLVHKYDILKNSYVTFFLFSLYLSLKPLISLRLSLLNHFPLFVSLLYHFSLWDSLLYHFSLSLCLSFIPLLSLSLRLSFIPLLSLSLSLSLSFMPLLCLSLLNHSSHCISKSLLSLLLF